VLLLVLGAAAVRFLVLAWAGTAVSLPVKARRSARSASSAVSARSARATAAESSAAMRQLAFQFADPLFCGAGRRRGGLTLKV
jgi:hypothetical protein